MFCRIHSFKLVHSKRRLSGEINTHDLADELVVNRPALGLACAAGVPRRRFSEQPIFRARSLSFSRVSVETERPDSICDRRLLRQAGEHVTVLSDGDLVNQLPHTMHLVFKLPYILSNHGFVRMIYIKPAVAHEIFCADFFTIGGFREIVLDFLEFDGDI